ncbi:immunoglobulin superfamily containing leucine-rich repeat protein 2-like [Dunckerocampus dactyliophorus]|uniref:immunoglobulin superfamily containing leucine-rich repeat protein 2-like n=1 Tax=Dunckerocampus dactyliophorus TaxID=161453 RepID=UPI002404B2EB|nr:immunoglobulin superfamily containing leucine-rich repeat protein 2-like [Dunckerocampus dactyliophorus]
MAAREVLYLTVMVSTVLSALQECPTLCTCSIKYRRHFAECSYKDLAEIPSDLPHNVATVSLSANKIHLVPRGIFDNVTQMISLWMAHNEIVSIQPGSLTSLVHLRNFDISHNKVADFPWGDLQNLTRLQLLKMNHNEMVSLPRDALANLKDLRSLQLNNNKLLTISEGTFDSLTSLSHLQLFNNPFACTCSLSWFRDWFLTTTLSVPKMNLITCSTPKELKGEMIVNLAESRCTQPTVTIRTQPNVDNTTLYEGDALILTCEFKGNPKPLVMWSIRSRPQELTQSYPKERSTLSSNPVKIYHNGTIVISHLSKDDSGNYSCSASNKFGTATDSLVVKVSSEPTFVTEMTTAAIYNTTQQIVTATSVVYSVADRNDVVPTSLPTAQVNPQYFEELIGATKCGLTAKTIHISNHVSNRSVDDSTQYMFDFGVIALGVSETEATVRLNPLLIPRDRHANWTVMVTPDSPHNVSEKPHRHSDNSEEIRSRGLYLCVTTNRKHSPVLWSQIKEGINTYLLSGLRPGTNYSLCLTYKGEDCEVQVLFTTKRKAPNLIIIISVSICLLTVSTVPLLGATCFHLVYKYRSKTYKLIMKARDQYQMERTLATNITIHAPLTESQGNITISQLEEEATATESIDGEKEADTEESVMTMSVTLSQSRGNLDDCEVGSEFSEGLPLGAEAVNITRNEKYCMYISNCEPVVA